MFFQHRSAIPETIAKASLGDSQDHNHKLTRISDEQVHEIASARSHVGGAVEITIRTSKIDGAKGESAVTVTSILPAPTANDLVQQSLEQQAQQLIDDFKAGKMDDPEREEMTR
jgi:hypothetical protein